MRNLFFLILILGCKNRNENSALFSDPFYRIYRYESDSLRCIAKNSNSLYYSINWNENNSIKSIKTKTKNNQGVTIEFSDSIDFHILKYIEVISDSKGNGPFYMFYPSGFLHIAKNFEDGKMKDKIFVYFDSSLMQLKSIYYLDSLGEIYKGEEYRKDGSGYNFVIDKNKLGTFSIE